MAPLPKSRVWPPKALWAIVPLGVRSKGSARPKEHAREQLDEPGSEGYCSAHGDQDDAEAEDAQSSNAVAERAADGHETGDDHQRQVKDPLAGGHGDAQRGLLTDETDLGRRHVYCPGREAGCSGEHGEAFESLFVHLVLQNDR